MTVAVCDSGPLTHLWQIGMWSAFSTFRRIHIARQVGREISRHVPLDRFEDVASGCLLQEHQPTSEQILSASQVAPEARALQEADLATLVVANTLMPDFVLTDDLPLRCQ